MQYAVWGLCCVLYGWLKYVTENEGLPKHFSLVLLIKDTHNYISMKDKNSMSVCVYKI